MSRVFVQGQGAVSPAGWGSAALRASLEPGLPLPAQALPRPGWEKPLAARLIPPPLEKSASMNHPRLRRASPVTHYSVSAALEALGGDAALVSSGALPLGIIVCTMTGGISYSRRFYQEVMQNPATASPLVFPETVFNAAASHLSACLGSVAANYTLVGDAGTFLQGLALAAEWLDEGAVEGCVVIGAEETDWTAADALRLFERGSVHAAGAGALYLKRESTDAGAVEMTAVTDSFRATRTASREESARNMRLQLPAGRPDELLCESESGNAAWEDWTGARLTPGPVLGEAFAASAAWQCVAACDAIQRGQYPAANVSVTGLGRQNIGARFVNADAVKNQPKPSP